MNCNEMIELLQTPEKLNTETKAELGKLTERFPYFLLARLLYVLNLRVLHDFNYRAELQKLALYAPNRSLLLYYFEPQLRSYFEKEATGKIENSSFDLIDSFLAMNESESAATPEIRLIGNDYFSAVTYKGDALPDNTITELPDEQDKIIEAFLEKGETQVQLKQEDEDALPQSPETSSLEDLIDDESYFTETLAKIYIRQKKYEKALEIIKRISLKYPKKNSYFADQIRFLEKLIVNVKRNI
ncbi:MAG: hypothetical protein PUB21_11950 [Bacteroidales bacterium]|nr:hypothetical protein [Bacteroidales bacterium]